MHRLRSAAMMTAWRRDDIMPREWTAWRCSGWARCMTRQSPAEEVLVKKMLVGGCDAPYLLQQFDIDDTTSTANDKTMNVRKWLWIVVL